MHLDPSSKTPEPNLTLPRLIPWNHISDAKVKDLPVKGRATYRLTLLGLEPRSQGYSIVIPGPIGARRLIVSEQESGDILADFQVGIIDQAKGKDSVRDITLLFFPKKTVPLLLTVHVQVVEGVTGGIFYTPILSEGDRVMSYRIFFATIDLFALTVGFLVGAYNLAVYVWRRNEAAAFYLALGAFAMAMRVFGTSVVMRNMLPESMAEFIRKCEYLPICSAPFFLFVFLQRAFPLVASRLLWERIFTGFMLVVIGFILLFPYRIYSQGLVFFQLYSLAASWIALVVLLRALFTRQPDTKIAFVGFIVVLSTLVWDIVCVNILSWSDIQLVPFGVSIFFTFQSALIMIRTERSSQAARELAEKNADIQKNLLFETEERLILAASVAHHINNPLNYIQSSKEALVHDLAQYNSLLSKLLGEDDPAQPELYQVQMSVKALARDTQNSLATMDQGLKRAGKAVRDIRMLSGIDGNPLSHIQLIELMPQMLRHLHEVESPMQLSRLHTKCQLVKGQELLGNEAVLIHALEFIVALALEHSKGELYLTESFKEGTSYHLHLQGGFHIPPAEQEQAMKRMQHIIHSDCFLFTLKFESLAWDFEVSPAQEEIQDVA